MSQRKDPIRSECDSGELVVNLPDVRDKAAYNDVESVSYIEMGPLIDKM